MLNVGIGGVFDGKVIDNEGEEGVAGVMLLQSWGMAHGMISIRP